MSARLLSGLLLTISLLACVTANTWHPTPEDFKRFMGDAYTGTESFVELRSKIIARVRDTAADYIEHHPAKNSLQSKDYPYFGFVPQFLSTIVPGGASASWEALCFQKNTATATANPANPNEITLTLTLSQPKSLLCSDNYLFATVSGLQMKSFFFHGTHNVTWTLPTNASASEAWDLSTKGVRVFQFLDNSLQTVADLLSTVLLFGSELSKNVPQWVSNVNLDFLAKYAGVKMTPRKVQSVSIDESLIHSGDFFGVMRLDGLDPMLAWAMGATTGHTTVALRDPTTGQLYVCESTTNSNYWPTNGIQKTPYQQWILQARAAGYHVVHAPLSADARAAFNETAAWEFFRGVEGLDYGFYNMLWGWIDTLEENYPCLPPDFKVCLQWQHMEVVFALVNRLVPSISDLMWGQAFNIRVGTEGLPMSDVYYQAAQQSLPIESVPTLVEKDDFNYTTHRGNVTVKDKSMVCCVFVCNMWKHAGVFDSIGRDSVNCAELTNWDDYALSIFDTTTPRPEACVNADPENPLCQLEGQYTLSLNDFATKKPYSHMAERCPSQPPAYKKPADC